MTGDGKRQVDELLVWYSSFERVGFYGGVVLYELRWLVITSGFGFLVECLARVAMGGVGYTCKISIPVGKRP